MGSQFVDFNADGRIDYFTATFDGSPHVALGTEQGFAEPFRILDRDGKRVILTQHWDYKAEEWRDIGQGQGHCTSAVAFDWDADGDLDLLLGTYGDGNLFLQRNEGKPGEAQFTGKNEPVFAGGKPFALEGGMTAPRLVDWDGDGLMDLVCGSFGESWKATPPGGVYLYHNIGKVDAPEFAAAVPLIEPQEASDKRERPNVGLYADPVDYDGDGDLDLLVGGYAIWTPAARPRNAEVEQQLEALIRESKIEAAKLLRSELTSKPERKAGVWLYLREKN